MKSQTVKLLSAAALLTLGIGGRMLLQPLNLPNVETLTTVMLLAGSLLGARYAMWIAGITIVATDIIIGNDMIFLFTWSAWILIAVAAVGLRRWNARPAVFTIAATLSGVASTFFFYLWTNAGVWLISGMYEHTAAGLLRSYIMGLPFLKNELLGNAVIVPIAAFLASFVYLKMMRRFHATSTAQPVVATEIER